LVQVEPHSVRETLRSAVHDAAVVVRDFQRLVGSDDYADAGHRSSAEPHFGGLAGSRFDRVQGFDDHVGPSVGRLAERFEGVGGDEVVEGGDEDRGVGLLTSTSSSCALLNNAAFELVREPGKFLIQHARIERVG
jgi:hypothetical protein